MTEGNWLQDLLNWYWITPWQLGFILVLEMIVVVLVIAYVMFRRI